MSRLDPPERLEVFLVPCEQRARLVDLVEDNARAWLLRQVPSSSTACAWGRVPVGCARVQGLGQGLGLRSRRPCARSLVDGAGAA